MRPDNALFTPHRSSYLGEHSRGVGLGRRATSRGAASTTAEAGVVDRRTRSRSVNPRRVEVVVMLVFVQNVGRDTGVGAFGGKGSGVSSTVGDRNGCTRMPVSRASRVLT